MCGIVGLFGESDETAVREMLQRLAHRGPDGERCSQLSDITAVLGHRRLAIIDPVGGDQPIPDLAAPDRRAIVSNGMLYNYRQIRERFAEEPFVTSSDAESIFKICLADDTAAVDQLDGMFAFLVVNGNRLIAARDPIGIKPLYFARTGDRLVFASEIKAFSGLDEGIEEFPAGHVLTADLKTGEHTLDRYFRVPEPTSEIHEVNEAVERIRETLKASVAKRLQSDVPLGCFLSGGLDSSIITALACRHQPDMHTFAVGIEGSNDLLASRRVAEHLGTRHHEFVITADDVREALPQILYYLESYDRDLVRSAVPCWFVSQLASKIVTVVLTGEGADELFAGYAYHKTYHDGAALMQELHRSIGAMHNVNLQRVDRMTMAHGLEARVPFLDRDVIELGMQIAPELKLPPGSSSGDEKWILRKAFEDLLPHEIVWRDKEQFDEGSGLSGLLQQIVPSKEPVSALPDGRRPRNSEEAWYARLLGERFVDAPAVFRLTARWEDNRVD
ncbi:Asparagine synthetase B [glutamine-hydrolyzing] [Maioricimonas rarisocia]|uniref:asparagine synthase (glutamine-hydrolyzing) n=1 Tax=Maioricimonas rarisocia TaxID=2528026 RepID=A0A517Z6H4_9PLAN|nr:asparagine synthase (glutamine-hydrolyzing) [Maioricimonas rarisocia]QDU38021.1 Asparagine synthetase B [glutamine-hydrolyzing] [Maioricimonas rarisocia]